MSKTDKELTIEATNNFVNAWNNAATKTTPVTHEEYIALIKSVHTTIQNLPEKKS